MPSTETSIALINQHLRAHDTKLDEQTVLLKEIRGKVEEMCIKDARLETEFRIKSGMWGFISGAIPFVVLYIKQHIKG